jgi:hypothetical protein
MTFYELIRASLLWDAEQILLRIRGSVQDEPPESDKRRKDSDLQADS